MYTLEKLEQEYAAKREQLTRDLALARVLPTNGVTVSWEGENGWDEKGQAKPSIQKTLEVKPWIIHGDTAYHASRHVAYQDEGEHVSSKFRGEFQKRYLATLLDTYAPHMLQTVAVRGTYASTFPETFAFQENHNYKNAKEVARGLYELTADLYTGENHFSTCKLEFYSSVPEPLKVSMAVPYSWKFAPRGNTDDHGEARNWTFPALSDVGAVNLFKRAGASMSRYGVPTGYTLQWLFADRMSLETALEGR